MMRTVAVIGALGLALAACGGGGGGGGAAPGGQGAPPGGTPYAGPVGQGEGKLSVATKITISKDGKEIELENYSTQPVLLQSVKASA